MKHENQLKILQIGESWITDRIGCVNRYFTSFILSLIDNNANVNG